MKVDRKINYLENTLYSNWVFQDALQETMKQHEFTKEQALSLLRNALENYECPVAKYWLENWRILISRKSLFCNEKENVPPPSSPTPGQLNKIGSINKSTVNFNNNASTRLSSKKRKADNVLKKCAKKKSDKDEEYEKEDDEENEERKNYPEDVWEYFKKMLDLGRDNEKYHKYSAIRNGVIICGDGILAQKEIDSDKYRELKNYFSNQPVSTAHSELSKAYLSSVLVTDNTKDFERKIRSIPSESGEDVFYLQDICFTVLNLIKNNPDVRDDEKNFVDFCITPLMKATVNLMAESYAYESREACLKSINTIWKNNKTIKSTSEGYKADGIVRYKELEIMLVEACGVYGNTAMSKIQFDRHKGLYACLAMLRTIAVKYKYASVNSFEKINILFLHSKGHYLQLWSVSFTNNIFIFHRIERCELSLEFEFKSQTISNCIKFLHIIEERLRLTVNSINTLSIEHITAINNDILGIENLNEVMSLETIVCPQMHKIKESKGSDASLCYEDPVSCTE